ncbi:hypothetical protein B0H11DRAFT_2030156 [Mycena galericulata]|nr:hypothetical protein B0H11DRAFT_2030156 [Mycena galericulata]
MLAKYSTSLAKQSLDARWARATPPLTSIHRVWRRSTGSITAPPQDKEKRSRVPWGERKYTPVTWEQTPFEGRWDTVCIHNAPPEASISDVLDVVLFGPIFHAEDYTQDGSRVVALTFFDPAVALAFYQDATSNKFIFYGNRLEFSWGKGPSPPQNPWTASRAMMFVGVDRLGTEETLPSILNRIGPFDRFQIVRQAERMDRGYINWLSVSTCQRAVQYLRKEGFTVSLITDRCKVAGSARNAGMRNRSRTVLLLNIPPMTSVADLGDQIRGGALERIIFIPKSGVAYVHFLSHTSAAAFLRYAMYQGIVVNNQRLRAEFKTESQPLPPHVLHSVAMGASRCLRLQGAAVDQDTLWKGCRQYGTIENVSTSGSTSTVTFTHLAEAIKASRLLTSKEPFQGLQVDFIEDPCAKPFPREIEDAEALQAEIASLLLPPEVTESVAQPPDTPRSSEYRET